MKKVIVKPQISPSETDSPESRGLAIQIVTRLDIPAKGRIAHHIRRGRIHAALSLCKNAHQAIWEKTRRSSQQALWEQRMLLSRLQDLLTAELAPLQQNA